MPLRFVRPYSNEDDEIKIASHAIHYNPESCVRQFEAEEGGIQRVHVYPQRPRNLCLISYDMHELASNISLAIVRVINSGKIRKHD